MKKLIFGLIILGLTIHTYAQEIKTIELSEVVISATNYKYLNKTGLENASIPVALLEQKVASYDIASSEFYDDEYDSYIISFYIPEGSILATYDKEGTILRTAERFKDVTLPIEVRNSIAKQYPNWSFEKDLYLVNYYDKSGNITKKYKITLINGDKRIKVKCDAEGNIL
ncbi:nicotinate-nucleotide adenylyltransferase [Lutibacter sp. HS1-25]|uniref:nicotinate-nucleotide adenylyltransferase n=1 Tax=Lutibacter sp. HS1-25 TaxID=2485000 RepID=UPI001011A495|nr:nicotinate-nucleotide adenylyltransferase [Lutibacter sp. HS1-25]RXP63583.1 nicotinate-nucleotide adenylyltransferase [Lutibacter sp. HS1-25]